RLIARLVDHIQRDVGQAVLRIERVERGLKIGIMVQVDDCDRLPRAVARDLRPRGRRERDRIQAVGLRDLGRREAREQTTLIKMFSKRTKSPRAALPHHRWFLEEFNRGVGPAYQTSYQGHAIAGGAWRAVARLPTTNACLYLSPMLDGRRLGAYLIIRVRGPF